MEVTIKLPEGWIYPSEAYDIIRKAITPYTSSDVVITVSDASQTIPGAPEEFLHTATIPAVLEKGPRFRFSDKKNLQVSANMRYMARGFPLGLSDWGGLGVNNVSIQLVNKASLDLAITLWKQEHVDCKNYDIPRTLDIPVVVKKEAPSIDVNEHWCQSVADVRIVQDMLQRHPAFVRLTKNGTLYSLKHGSLSVAFLRHRNTEEVKERLEQFKDRDLKVDVQNFIDAFLNHDPDKRENNQPKGYFSHGPFCLTSWDKGIAKLRDCSRSNKEIDLNDDLVHSRTKGELVELLLEHYSELNDIPEVAKKHIDMFNADIWNNGDLTIERSGFFFVTSVEGMNSANIDKILLMANKEFREWCCKRLFDKYSSGKEKPHQTSDDVDMPRKNTIYDHKPELYVAQDIEIVSGWDNTFMRIYDLRRNWLFENVMYGHRSQSSLLEGLKNWFSPVLGGIAMREAMDISDLAYNRALLEELQKAAP